MRIWLNRQGKLEEELVQVEGDQIVIGRSALSDVTLDSQFVPNQAAILNRRGAQWELISCCENPIEVGETVVLNNERVLIPSGQTIGIFPYEVSLDRPAGGGAPEDRRTQIDRRMSELIMAIHTRVVPRIETDNADKEQRNSPDFNRRVEVEIEEFARLEGLFRDSEQELLVHVAAKAVESLLIGRMVEEADVWDHGEAWTQLHEVNRQIEGELESLAAGIEQQLGLQQIEDLSERIGVAEDGFWDAWESVVDALDLNVMKYAAVRYLKKQVKDALFGYGPLEDLLRMPNISEIMVVDSDRLYIEKGGVLEKSGRRFVSDEVTETIIERIVSKVDRQINKSTPLADARLLDGSRVNAVIHPIAISGPCLTIRKFPARKLEVSDLVAKGSLSPSAARFLEAAVISGKNILIAGGTGTGKTTMLNCLSNFIPDKERIVTIEDTAELQLHKEHVVKMETKPANNENVGAYPISKLVENSLRMRPDRIVVGECRGPEALDMLQAMNTGHDGSMTTIHANTSRDCILRLEVLVQQAADLPIESIHRQIASAIDLVVQLSRLRSGARCVTQITEFAGYDKSVGHITTKDLFFRDAHDEDSELLPTGSVPTFMGELVGSGLIDLNVFLL